MAAEIAPYPGTINQPDREFKKRDEYHTFEHTINHETPDMRTEWRDDERDEIGFPIAEDNSAVEGDGGEGKVTASVSETTTLRQAAGKAVKLAMLLLGEKVAEEVIEAQAKDFMKLGSESLDSALSRFADSETLYVAEEDKEEDKEVEAAKEEDKEEDKEVEAAKEEDKEEDKEVEAAKEEDKEDKEEEKEAADEVKEEDEVEAKKSSTEMDIELQAGDDEDEGESDEKEAALLASIFAEDDDAVEAPKVASAKRGAQTLGSQPMVKVASEMSTNDISAIWQDAPDVSEVFGN